MVIVAIKLLQELANPIQQTQGWSKKKKKSGYVNNQGQYADS